MPALPKAQKKKSVLEIHPPPMDHLLFFETISWFGKIRLGDWEVKKEPEKEFIGKKRQRPEEVEGDEQQGEAEDEDQGKPRQRTKIRDELFWFQADVVDIENETSKMVTVPSSTTTRSKPAKRPRSDLKKDLHKFINVDALKGRVSERVMEYGEEVEVAEEVDDILSIAVQNWTRHLIERLVFQSKKRRDLGKDEANVQILNSVGKWLQTKSKREALRKEREGLEAKKVSGKISSSEMTRLLTIERELSKGGDQLDGDVQEEASGSSQEDLNLVNFVKQSVIPELSKDNVLSTNQNNKKMINMKDGISLMRSTKCSSRTLYKTMVKS